MCSRYVNASYDTLQWENYNNISTCIRSIGKETYCIFPTFEGGHLASQEGIPGLALFIFIYTLEEEHGTYKSPI